MLNFIQHMKELSESQYSGIQNAIIRKGNWELIDDLSDLEVPSYVWFSTYSEEMKKQRLSKVLSVDFSKVTCLTSNLNMPLKEHDKMDDTSSHSPNAINPEPIILLFHRLYHALFFLKLRIYIFMNKH